MPCTDGVNAIDKVRQEIVKASHQQDSHSNTDACSPFCSCSCCAASVLHSPFSKAQINKIEFQPENYPLYNVSFSTEAHNSIWQPPKLS